MVTIQIDEQTAKELERQARTAGVTVAEYLRSLVPAPAATSRPSWDDIENQIVALSTPTNTDAHQFSGFPAERIQKPINSRGFQPVTRVRVFAPVESR